MTKTQPTATGSAIPPPAWSTSPACCLQNRSASRSRTWTPASTNGATTSADVPSTTAGATTTAPRRSRRTCGSANSRTGCRKSPSQSLKTPCIQRPDYRASTTCPSSASSMNTLAHQASPSTPTTPVSAPRSRPSACWPSGRVVDAPRPRLPTAQPARRSRDWLLPHDDGPQPTGLDTSDQMRPSPPTQRTPAFAYVPQRPQPGRRQRLTNAANPPTDERGIKKARGRNTGGIHHQRRLRVRRALG